MTLNQNDRAAGTGAAAHNESPGEALTAPGEPGAIEILIDTEELTSALRGRLARVLGEHPGRSAVYLRLRNRRSGQAVLFLSRGYSVRVSDALTDGLQQVGIRSRIINGEQ